jgi:hypothetical protein
MTLLKGALVSFTPTFLPVPVPDVTVFQFNPESLTHTWTQPTVGAGDSGAAAADGGGSAARSGTTTGNPMAVAGYPGEQFDLTIVLDANEDIADGGPSGALASVSGVYTRLAAMEMLLYPANAASSSLLGQASAAIAGALGGGGPPPQNVPDSTIPITLFIWGPFRIVPVRLNSLTVTETLFDSALNPVHAEAKLALKVLSPAELQATGADSDVLSSVATIAYEYTLSVREVAALANLANAAQSIIGMLPH